MKILLGIPTFGNLAFTKLCLQGCRETLAHPADVCAIVGQPGDWATEGWLHEQGIPHRVHDVNLGLPVALNDLYDAAFVNGAYDAVIILGNDVIPYPKCLDRLIAAAEQGYDWCCGNQFDVQSLCAMYPLAARHFEGATLNFRFEGEPWTLHRGWETDPADLVPGQLKDVHNCCLFTRRAFEQIGYVDANFFPAYFEDNDYARRAVNLGIRYVAVNGAQYFHFWSRTIHQGCGGSTSAQFQASGKFYETKWGGPFGQEGWRLPFDGKSHTLTPEVLLLPELRISRRDSEAAIAKYWRER